MTDPDFTETLENGEIVVRYKGKECLRGKCNPELPPWTDPRVANFIALMTDDFNNELEQLGLIDVKPDAIVGE